MLKSWSLKEMVCCENIDMVVVLDATPEEIQCMDALVIVYSSDARNYDFGMDALVIVWFRNTNVIMILAWMLW